MIGAGFGGCIIALVNEQKVKDFIKNVGTEYMNLSNYNATFYDVEIDDGVKIINIQ